MKSTVVHFSYKVLMCSLVMTCLESTPLLADAAVCKEQPVCKPAPVCPPPTYAYAPGTFSIKPINVSFSNLTFGKRRQDSFLATPSSKTINNIKTDVFNKAVDLGFAESDRNGVGYGIELGYLIMNDWEFFARGGYCREEGHASFSFGSATLKFKNRHNYGFSFGPRKYFDFQSPWKPFVQAAAGFTVQGQTKALISWHKPPQADVPISIFQLAKRKTLFNFEFGLGTDYAFTDYVALSFNVVVRYNQRDGGSFNNIPGNFTAFHPSVLPTTLTYKDDKQRWCVPFTFSLKFMF